MNGTDGTPEAWMAMSCSRCHVTLNWTGNPITQGNKANGYETMKEQQ